MNSRERRAQAYRAKCAADNRLGRKIESTLSGCSDRVMKAVTAPAVRSKPDQSAGSICMGDVAIYQAGHRGKPVNPYHIIK